MPNIEMCDNDRCQHSTDCKRHRDSGTIPNDSTQTWKTFLPDDNINICDGWWPVFREVNRK